MYKRKAVLRPGDEVMQIVPTGEKLIVEAQASPRDIAFIQVGQKATVKFDPFHSAIHGSGVGVVSYVSPDTSVPVPSTHPTPPTNRHVPAAAASRSLTQNKDIHPTIQSVRNKGKPEGIHWAMD